MPNIAKNNMDVLDITSCSSLMTSMLAITSGIAGNATSVATRPTLVNTAIIGSPSGIRFQASLSPQATPFSSLPGLVITLQSPLMSASYQEALDYLYGFVNFEHRRLDRYAPENISLDRVGQFLEHLGNPQESFPSIHIAGTKGKGSVAAMCAFSLRASGLRCGLYTSPHLQDFRDRIRVLTSGDAAGRISENQVVDLVERIKPAVEKTGDLTWYEIVTAIGFLHFANEKVDVAVVEVGLGGRLDATNVLVPLVSVITSISLDHTYLLGNSVAEIAVEKGGIIKDGIPVISAPQDVLALGELERIAAERQAPISVIGREWGYEADDRPGNMLLSPLVAGQSILVTKAPESALVTAGTHLTIGLAGRHQQDNAMVAVATLNAVSQTIGKLSLEDVRQGLAQVIWPGRMEILAAGGGAPTLLVDCAHNVDSAQKLARSLEQDSDHRRLLLVIGITEDKDTRGILEALLPLADHVIATTSGHPRASKPEDLVQQVSELGFSAELQPDLLQAILAARRWAGQDDLICVTGSIFVVGDLLNHWEGLQSTWWEEGTYRSHG